MVKSAMTVRVLFCALFFVTCTECVQGQNIPERDSSWVNQSDLIVDVKGIVLDEKGMPVPGATVRFVDPRTIFDPDFKPTCTMTDSEGKFHLKYNIVDAFRHLLVAELKEKEFVGSFSFAFELYDEKKPINMRSPEIKTDSAGKVISSPPFNKKMLESISLVVKKSPKIFGKVVDLNDKPVEGAYVGVRYQRVNQSGDFDFIEFPGAFTDAEGQYSFLVTNGPLKALYAVQNEKGIGSTREIPDYYNDKDFANFLKQEHLLHLEKYPTRVRLIDQKTKKPRTDVWVRPRQIHYFSENNATPFYAVPDANGVAHLPWTYPMNEYCVFDPKSFGSSNNSYNEHPQEETEIQINNHPTRIYGRIQFPDGKPATGIRLVYKSSLHYHREGGTNVYNQTWADSQGRYEISSSRNVIWSGNEIDTLTVYFFPDVDGFVPSKLPVANFPADGTPFRFDIDLRKPTVIRGVVTKNHLQFGKTPAKGVVMTLTGCPEERWQMSGIGRQTESWIQKTNEQGEYHFEVGPGFYLLQGDNNRIWTPQIDVESQEEIVVDLEMKRNDMSGTVIDVSDNRKLVSGIEVGVPKFGYTFDFGYLYSNEAFPQTKTAIGGKFRFEELKHNDTMFLAKGTSKNLYGLAIVDEPKENIEIAVAPLQKVSGRLIRAEDETPLANYDFKIKAVKIQEVSPNNPFRYWDMNFPELKGITDTDGRFECSGLIYGVDYSLRLQPKDIDGWEVEVSFTEEDEICLFRVDKPEEKQLHDISVPRSKYEPNGHQMHNATMIGPFYNDFSKKLSRAQELAKKNDQNIVFLLTAFNSAPHHLFLKTFYENPDVRSVSRHYQLLIRENRRSSDYDREKFAPIAEKLGLKPDDATEPTLCILDAEGKLLEMVPFDSLRKKSESERPSDEIESEKLIELLQKYQN